MKLVLVLVALAVPVAAAPISDGQIDVVDLKRKPVNDLKTGESEFSELSRVSAPHGLKSDVREILELRHGLPISASASNPEDAERRFQLPAYGGYRGLYGKYEAIGTNAFGRHFGGRIGLPVGLTSGAFYG